MASTLDGLAGIDDFDTSFIAFLVGPVGGKTRSCSRDRMERTCLVASSNSSKEFVLSRTQGSNSLGLRTVNNSVPASGMTKPVVGRLRIRCDKDIGPKQQHGKSTREMLELYQGVVGRASLIPDGFQEHA